MVGVGMLKCLIVLSAALLLLALACAAEEEPAPPTPTPIDVEGIVGRALAGVQPGVTSEEVAGAIQQALAAQPGVTSQDVANEIAKALAAQPGGVTSAEMASAIASALERQESLTAEDVAGEIAKALAAQQPGVTSEEVAAAIQSALAERPGVTEEQVAAAIERALAAQRAEIEAAMQVPEATATPEPVAVVIDNCGVETVYEAAPQRVVATDTSALEVLMALGLQEHVIGYFGGAPDRLQPQNQARAALVERLGGSFPYPSLEAVLAPGPDLVFSYGFNESAGLTGQNLRDADVHSFSFTEACPDFAGKVTLEVMFEDVRAVARIFGVEERGEELIAVWERQIADVAAAIPSGEAVRVFYFDSGEEAPFTALAGSVMSDIISRAGGTNILSDVSGTWGTVEWEAVVDGDPELIIFVDYGFGGPAANRAFLESNPSLSGMSAVVNGQYMSLTFLQSVPGPQNLDGLIEVATAVRRVTAAR